MERRSQLIVGLIVLALIAVAVMIALPTVLQTPRSVTVTTEVGEMITQSGYRTRYANIERSRTADGGFVLGDADAPVTIVEFADFMCPYCQDYQQITYQFIEQYVATGKAKFEYRMFPVVNPDYSVYTAQIAECTETQEEGIFWAAHDVLFDLASRGEINRETTTQTVAETLSLDADVLASCIETATQHEIDQALGDKAGVNSTPTMMIRVDDQTLAWAYIQGRTRNQGGLSLEALEAIVNAEDLSTVTAVLTPVLDNLTDDEPCAAPCWRGIVPGETFWADALAQVQTNREFVEFQEQTAPDGQQKGYFWRSLDGVNCCQMTSQDGETVDALFLLEEMQLTVGELIEARGEPVYAVANPTEDDNTVVNLFYPEDGLIVYVFVEGEGDDAFTEADRIVGAYYLSKALIDEIVDTNELIEWSGYDSFSDYIVQPTEEAAPTATGEA